MEITLPITKISGSKIHLPISIFHADDIHIYIDRFTSEDKKWFFNLTDLEFFSDGEVKYRFDNKRTLTGYNAEVLHAHIRANFKLIMSDTANNFDSPVFWGLEPVLDFVFRIIIGCGFLITKTKTDNEVFKDSSSLKNKFCVSRRYDTEIDQAIVDRVKNLFFSLKENNSFDDEKIKRLHYLLESAMSQVPNLGLTGALYVAILESLFAPEKDSEIGYRFSMRIAKLKNLGLEYQKKIKDMYDMRSVMFHSGNDKFKVNDTIFLEEEACWAIEEYILKPEKFSRIELDKLLLGNTTLIDSDKSLK